VHVHKKPLSSIADKVGHAVETTGLLWSFTSLHCVSSPSFQPSGHWCEQKEPYRFYWVSPQKWYFSRYSFKQDAEPLTVEPLLIPREPMERPVIAVLFQHEIMQTNQNNTSLKHLWRLLQEPYFHKRKNKHTEDLQTNKNPTNHRLRLPHPFSFWTWRRGTHNYLG